MGKYKDPWKKRHEIAKRLQLVSYKIQNIYISEDSYMYGEDPAYEREIDEILTMADKATTKIEKKVEGKRCRR